MNERAARKAAKRAELRELFQSVGTESERPRHYSQRSPDTCYSQTCADCGKVWLSAIKRIEPNTWRSIDPSKRITWASWRNRKRVYVCSPGYGCRK